MNLIIKRAFYFRKVNACFPSVSLSYQLRSIGTDIGTEELAHLEMVGTIVYQLTRNLTPEQIKAGGYDAYFIDHTTGIYPSDASGNPFNAATFSSTGDTIADIHEDMAADGATLYRLHYPKIIKKGRNHADFV